MTKRKRRQCKQGTMCGNACISRSFACLDVLSLQGQEIAANLVSLSRTVAISSHFGSLYSYTDKSGKQWFAKKFASIETSSVEAEARAYTEAQRLGISAMLIRPKFVDLGNGKLLAVWPKVEAVTLREWLAAGNKLTDSMRQSLAVCKQFDAVIRNADRNLGNVLVQPDGRLRLIDHDAAFSNQYNDQLAHASNMTLLEAENVWRL